jgi:hypothetical protein
MKNISRRSFIKNSAQTIMAGSIFAGDLLTEKPAKSMFIHHVYFWLAKPDSKEDLQQLLKALHVLKNVPVIKKAHIGLPATTSRDVIDRSYQVSWLLFFDNLEDEEIYQKHPMHLKFVEENKHLWTKVIVYDSVDVSM